MNRNVRIVLIAWAAAMLALGLHTAINDGIGPFVETCLLTSIALGVLALNLRGGGQ